MKKMILPATIGVAIIAAIVVAIAMRHQSARVQNSWFDPDTDNLRRLPAGLLIVRPTRFPNRSADMRHLHEDSSAVTRAVGRNVPLRNIVAEACDCAPARVLMPPNTPPGGYDYIVTTGVNARKDLGAALERELGYTEHSETRIVDVWAVKVLDPNLPGLTVSPDSEPADESIRNGKPYLIHQPVGAILDSLTQGLDEPVLDETGLTNCYNYSVTWKNRRDNAFSLATVMQVLRGWGLRLEPDNAPVDMIVVQKVL